MNQTDRSLHDMHKLTLHSLACQTHKSHVTSILLWTACLSHLERLVNCYFEFGDDLWVMSCWMLIASFAWPPWRQLISLLLLSFIFTRFGSGPTSHILSFIFIVRESPQSDLYLFHLQFHSVILFHLVKPWLRFSPWEERSPYPPCITTGLQT